MSNNLAQKFFELSENFIQNTLNKHIQTVLEDAENAATKGRKDWEFAVDRKFSNDVVKILEDHGFTKIHSADEENNQTRIRFSWDTVAKKKQENASDEKMHLVLYMYRDSWSPADNGYFQEELFFTEKEAREVVKHHNSKNNSKLVPESYTVAEYMGFTTKRLKDF